MKYSVIVPVYNASATLSRCVNSILLQQYPDFELLLIDDGSSDDSPVICDSYMLQDSRVRVFHIKNSGVSVARNLGIEQACGDWITFVDADDYIEQNFFPTDIPLSVDLVINNWKSTDNDLYDEYLVSQIVLEYEIKSFLREHLDKALFRCPWSKFFKSKIIRQNHIRFDSRFRIGEDTLFVFDYLLYVLSILVNNCGCYKYNILPQEKGALRYMQGVEKTLQFMDSFWMRYRRLDCDNVAILRLLYSFYEGKTINIKKTRVYKKWITNRSIIEILYKLYYRQGIFGEILYKKLLIESYLYNSAFYGKI